MRFTYKRRVLSEAYLVNVCCVRWSHHHLDRLQRVAVAAPRHPADVFAEDSAASRWTVVVSGRHFSAGFVPKPAEVALPIHLRRDAVVVQQLVVVVVIGAELHVVVIAESARVVLLLIATSVTAVRAQRQAIFVSL